jgi:hypothetical protein
MATPRKRVTRKTTPPTVTSLTPKVEHPVPDDPTPTPTAVLSAIVVEHPPVLTLDELVDQLREPVFRLLDAAGSRMAAHQPGAAAQMIRSAAQLVATYGPEAGLAWSMAGRTQPPVQSHYPNDSHDPHDPVTRVIDVTII